MKLSRETVLATGAIAFRMSSGGRGGAAIAIVSRDLFSSLERAVTAEFAAAGFGAPSVFTVAASAGAA